MPVDRVIPASLVLLLALIVPTAGGRDSETKEAAAHHPVVASPEATLAAILDGYVRRDPDTVLAYVHPAVRTDPDRMARWAQMVARLTTDKLHVVRVIGIELQGVSSRGPDKVADLAAIIETTPAFSGGRDLGRNQRQYRWSLVQLKGTGIWYHDGGGF